MPGIAAPQQRRKHAVKPVSTGKDILSKMLQMEKQSQVSTFGKHLGQHLICSHMHLPVQFNFDTDRAASAPPILLFKPNTTFLSQLSVHKRCHWSFSCPTYPLPAFSKLTRETCGYAVYTCAPCSHTALTNLAGYDRHSSHPQTHKSPKRSQARNEKRATRETRFRDMLITQLVRPRRKGAQEGKETS